METRTTPEVAVPETPAVAAPLALRDDAPLVAWTEDKRKLIRDQVCPAGISPGEFEVFMLQCIRSGLDPLLKQAFCVSRNMKVKRKKRGPNGGEMIVEEYVETHVFQPAVAGMLARAEEFPDYRGTTAAVFYEGEEVYPDHAQGIVVHKVKNAAEPGKRGKLVGAWAIVRREGRTPVISIRYLAECMDERNPVWKSYTRAMMLKCPQAEALRLAFPTQFGGLYDEAETRHTVDEEGTVDGSFRPPPPMMPPPPRETIEVGAATAQAGSLRGGPIEDGEIEEPGPDVEPPPWAEGEPGDIIAPVNASEPVLSPEQEEQERREAQILALKERIAKAENLTDLYEKAGKEIQALPMGDPVRSAVGPVYQARKKALTPREGGR